MWVAVVDAEEVPLYATVSVPVVEAVIDAARKYTTPGWLANVSASPFVIVCAVENVTVVGDTVEDTDCVPVTAVP